MEVEYQEKLDNTSVNDPFLITCSETADPDRMFSESSLQKEHSRKRKYFIFFIACIAILSVGLAAGFIIGLVYSKHYSNTVQNNAYLYSEEILTSS